MYSNHAIHVFFPTSSVSYAFGSMGDKTGPRECFVITHYGGCNTQRAPNVTCVIKVINDLVRSLEHMSFLREVFLLLIHKESIHHSALACSEI